MWSLVLLPLLCLTLVLAAGPGSTPDLPKVLFKRCEAFKKIAEKSGLIKKGKTDCPKITKTFLSAFMNKAPCDVTIESYKPVVDLTMGDLGKDKAVLWSGVYPFINPFAEEEGRIPVNTGTFMGYMADGLHFCGKKSAPGIDYKSCPGWGECPKDKGVESNFWKAVSKGYANMAEGDVTILLNGTDTRPAFRTTSILAEIELPNLTKKVKTLEAVVVHTPGEKISDQCNQGSLVALKKKVRASGFKFRCVDDPKATRKLQCEMNKEWCVRSHLRKKNIHRRRKHIHHHHHQISVN